MSLSKRDAVNFHDIDLLNILSRFLAGETTLVEDQIVASFAGKTLRSWQDEKALLEAGILRRKKLSNKS